jgi:predicted nucleotidyltransferase
MMSQLDVSTKAELQSISRVLGDISDQASTCRSEILVVGAVARDILITHVTGASPSRATADVDVAVAVSSWYDLEKLTDVFEPIGGSGHKFAVRGTEVDIIPFGGVESDDRTIRWPNDHVMSVLGFKEAHTAAIHVRISNRHVVPVASLPAQSLLKLFAWRDRRNLNVRDAIDLRSILNAYHQGPYEEELYSEYADLLIRHGFAPNSAGAERMGMEAAALMTPDTRGHVTRILTDDDRFELLVGDMGRLLADNRALLTAYLAGFRR